MPLIETTRGPIEEGLLVKETGVTDDATHFAYFVKYRLPGSDVVICHMEGGGFPKVNPFAAPRKQITTTIGEMDEADLQKTLGVVDNENEFTSWVECRMPGRDEIIHRSVDVKLKKAPPMQSAAGGF